MALEAALSLRVLIIHEHAEQGYRWASLAQTLGCDSVVVPNRAAALSALDGAAPDAVLLSLTLPEHAFDVARELRAKLELHPVRFIGLSRVPTDLPLMPPFDAWLKTWGEVDAVRTALGLDRRRPQP
jgi:CheY-like chemotaxis protein